MTGPISVARCLCCLLACVLLATSSGCSSGPDFDGADTDSAGDTATADEDASSTVDSDDDDDADAQEDTSVTADADGDIDREPDESAGNLAPVASDDEAIVGEDGTLSISVLENDSDPDGDLLEIADAGTAEHGTATVGDDGQSIVYAGVLNYAGTDFLTYTVTDGRGGSATARVEVTITPVNDAPLAVDDAVTTPEDTTLIIDVLTNDVDVDGDELTIVATTAPATGTLEPDEDGLLYRPAADFTGEATFDYTIEDPDGEEASATVTITVTSVNDLPLWFNTAELYLIPLSPTADDDLSLSTAPQAGDPEGEPIAFTWVWEGRAPTEGEFEEISRGEGAEVPALSGDLTEDEHTYRLAVTPCDVDGGCAATFVTGPVTIGNEAPEITNALVLGPDGARTLDDLALTEQPTATDAEGAEVTFIYRWQDRGLVGPWDDMPGQAGTADVIAPLGDVLTRKNRHYRLVVAPFDGSSTGLPVISSEITVQNTPPLAQDDAITVDEEAETTVTAAQLLANDDDPDEDEVLHITSTPSMAHVGARATMVGGFMATLTFTPEPDYVGDEAQVTFRVDDGEAFSDSVLAITIRPVNDAPVNVMPREAAIEEDSLLRVNTNGAVRIDDVDAGSDTLRVTLAAQGALTLGTSQGLTFSEGDGVSDAQMTFTGTLTDINQALALLDYLPPTDFNGSTELTITSSDLGHTGSGGALSDTDTLPIAVTPIDDTPDISDIAAQVMNRNTTLGPLAFTIDDIDTPVAGLTLSATSDNQLLIPNANLTLGGSGHNRTLTVRPAPNQVGEAYVTVVVIDGTSHDSTVFRVQVDFFNFEPTISAIGNQTTAEEVPLNVAFSVGDAETPLASLDVSVACPGALGCQLSGSGASRSLLITLWDNFTGNLSVTISVTDGDGAAAQQHFDVMVTAVNDMPTLSSFSAESLQAMEDLDVSGVVFRMADVEDPADRLAVSISSSNTGLLANDAFTLDDRGCPTCGERAIFLDPSTNAFGSATVTVTVTDSEGGWASYDVQLEVSAVNDDPTGSSIADQVIPVGGTAGPLAFTISDVDDPVSSLTLSALAPPDVFPPGSIVFAGSGTDRTVTLSPAVSYQEAPVTLLITDPHGGAGGTDFYVTVGSTRPTLSAMFNQTLNEEDALEMPFTVADAESPPGELTTTVSSDNPVLLPPAGLFITTAVASPGNRTLMVTPAADQSGTATIIVVVFAPDGGYQSASFVLTVNAINDAPVITLPGPQTVNEGTPLVFGGANRISVSDVDGGTAFIDATIEATGNVTLTMGPGQPLSGSEIHLVTTMADLNTVLASMTFVPTPHPACQSFSAPCTFAPDSITVWVSDRGNTGDGGVQSAQATLTVQQEPCYRFDFDLAPLGGTGPWADAGDGSGRTYGTQERVDPPVISESATCNDGTRFAACSVGTAGQPERVYRFIAPQAGMYEFRTEPAAGGQLTDTVLYLLSECASDDVLSGVPQDCSDDTGFQLFSRLTVRLGAGEVVYVVVDAFLTATEPWVLTATRLGQLGDTCGNFWDVACAPELTCVPTAPPTGPGTCELPGGCTWAQDLNDQAAGDFDWVTWNGAPLDCAFRPLMPNPPADVDIGSSLSGYDLYEPPVDCLAPSHTGVDSGAEAVWTFTPPFTGSYSISFDGLFNTDRLDSVVYVATDCGPADLDILGCDDNDEFVEDSLLSYLQLELEAGTPYMIFIDSRTPASEGAPYVLGVHSWTQSVGCTDGSIEEVFGNDMVGCSGDGTWDQRDNLCSLGSTSCSTEEWLQRNDGATPQHDYWTANNVIFSGGDIIDIEFASSAGTLCCAY